METKRFVESFREKKVWRNFTQNVGWGEKRVYLNNILLKGTLGQGTGRKFIVHKSPQKFLERKNIFSYIVEEFQGEKIVEEFPPECGWGKREYI